MSETPQARLVTQYPTDTLVYTAPYNLPISFAQLLAQAGGGGGGPGVTLPLAIADGGTGATTAAAALTALGALPLTGGTLDNGGGGALLTIQRTGGQQGLVVTGGTLQFAINVSGQTGGGGLNIDLSSILSGNPLGLQINGSATAPALVNIINGRISVGSPTGPAVTGSGNINISGSYYINGVQVTLGDPDSGGTGFRALRVPN